jgi:hypothetical protein
MKSNFIDVGKYKKLDKAVSRDIDDDNVIAEALLERRIIWSLVIKTYWKLKIVRKLKFYLQGIFGALKIFPKR